MLLDVLVIGAGSAGAAAAAACARAGLSTRCVDAGPLDRAGACWVNGVPAWAFAEGGLEPPVPPEVRGGGGAFHLIAGWSGPRVVVPPEQVGVLEVDMRHLVARLQRLATEAGAVLDGHTRVHEVEVLGPERARVHLGETVVEARTVVLAGGLRGPLSAQVQRTDLCTAVQQVHDIDDRQAAAAWLVEVGGQSGDALCFTGIAGGYSILNVRVEPEHGVASLLTGSIPALGHAAGRVVLDRFVAAHPWLGELRFGGARAIPLGLPRPLLGQGPLAWLGDAAGQVFAMHGSGIGAQLVAARLLARTLAGGGRPLDYSVAWHRRWGGLFAASAVFARFSSTLPVDQLAGIIDAGLMPPGLVGSGLLQRSIDPPLAELPGLIGAALMAPHRLRHLAPALLRMRRIHWLAGRYPERSEDVAAWADAMARLAAM